MSKTAIGWMCVLTCFAGLLPAQTKPADHPFAAEIAEYKKLGEPIEPADFEVHGVADADNAAIELALASAAIKGEDRAWQAYDKLPDIANPPTAKELQLLRAAVQANVGAIAHVDAAMTRKGVAWPVKMETPVLATLLRHLNGQRLLANYLQAHARLHHADGNDAEVINDIKRLVFISRANDHQGFVIGHLVALGILGVANDVVERAAPDLKVDEKAPAATLAELKQAIALLLDDEPSRKGYREGLLAERMSLFDSARCVIDGRLTTDKLQSFIGSKQPIPPITPASARSDAILCVAYLSDVIKSFDETTDFPSAMRSYPERPAELSKNRLQHGFAVVFFSPMDRALLTHYRATTERKLSAVALALRAYAAAHDGKLPEHLDDLVPDLLPAVPDDPMAEKQPIKYSASRQIIWSTGDDGESSDGNEAPAAGSKAAGRWQKVDAVMHLQLPSRK